MYILPPSSAETVTCSACRATFYVTLASVCPRCHEPLGFQYVAISFSAKIHRGDPPIYLAGELGNAVGALRLNASISRQRLAELSGSHVSYLSRFERGLIVPNLSTVARILRAVEVDRIILRVWRGKSRS